MSQTFRQAEEFTMMLITAVVYNDTTGELDLTFDDSPPDSIRLDLGITFTPPLIGKYLVIDARNRKRIVSAEDLAEDFEVVTP